MINLIAVASGGALGAVARYLTGTLTLRLLGPAFPWGTLTVNIVGSLIMGLFIAWLAKRSGTGHELKLFVATGFLGGFTTFSAFSLDVANLVEKGASAAAAGYILASVMLAILAVFAGLWAGRVIF